MRSISILLLCIGLSGCVSAGTQVTEQQAQQFQKGVTTEAEVVAKLGRPTATTVKDDGTRVDVYAFTQASPNAIDFVPIVGLLAGGASGKTATVSFSFDKSSVLISYSSTTSNVDVHTGIMN